MRRPELAITSRSATASRRALTALGRLTRASAASRLGDLGRLLRRAQLRLVELLRRNVLVRNHRVPLHRKLNAVTCCRKWQPPGCSQAYSDTEGVSRPCSTPRMPLRFRSARRRLGSPVKHRQVVRANAIARPAQAVVVRIAAPRVVYGNDDAPSVEYCHTDPQRVERAGKRRRRCREPAVTALEPGGRLALCWPRLKNDRCAHPQSIA